MSTLILVLLFVVGWTIAILWVGGRKVTREIIGVLSACILVIAVLLGAAESHLLAMIGLLIVAGWGLSGRM